MVIGGGAREHSLVWKLAHSPKVEEVYVAPGNAGTQATAHNLTIPPTNIEALAQAAQQHHIDLTVVGPEAPLALGIVDLFQSLDLPVFGPTQAATQLESSKVFAKQLMQKYGIPCARGVVFSSLSQARDYVKSQPLPIVIKADGLAAGKGAIVATSQEQAFGALSDMMERRIFGTAGDKVIVDEYLSGQEVSLLAFTDGNHVSPMVPACDYKRAFDFDRGPNTGGMGGYSPPSFFGQRQMEQVQRTILEPVVRAMAQEGMPYKGVLYAGLMVTSEGAKVLEFNARFGDPENQVMIPRLKTDLVDIMLAVLNGTLDRMKIEWSDEACVGVVMASQGYPGSYKTGFPITGLDKLDKGILVFHAGTTIREGIVTDGGRVLTVVARGKTLKEARDKVYTNLPRIHFEGCHYRKDIAATERVKRE
jgi:phosphoribosylamine--glycine ligase